MKHVKHTQALLRKRKMLLVLPLLVLPFVTLAFWAFGGGKTAGDSSPAGKGGLNMQLPHSQLLGDSNMNKLAFYEKAQDDAQKRREWLRSDPYYRDTDTTLLRTNHDQLETAILPVTGHPGYNPAPLNPSPYDRTVVSSEEKVMQKLAELNKAIQDPEHSASVQDRGLTGSSRREGRDFQLGGDIDRLEAMMQSVGNSGDEDPELRQLSSMMDRILDIQHPERVRERIRTASNQNKDAIYPVLAEHPVMGISLLGDTVDKMPGTSASHFYGLEDREQLGDGQTSVLASVHGTQTLASGSVVKLRLQQNIYVSGEYIPKGAFIYGTAEISGERLHISISSIRSGITILPVKLKVFDLNGMEGIYMPHSVQREVVKHSAGNTLQGLELSTIDPSLKAKAATAGISAARNLLSRKVSVEKVTLKGGYQVILQSM